METTQNTNFEDLVRENLAPLRGYIASLGAHGDLIDDLAQDVFVEAARHWKKYDPARPFRSWLFGIARNLVHQEFRKSSMRARLRKGLTTETLIHAELAETEKEAQLASSGAVEMLRQCVETLTDRMRRILELRFRLKKSTDSIAQILKMKGSAVRMALMRVRQALHECITTRLKGAEG